MAMGGGVCDGGRAYVAEETATAADGTNPTGMHSCEKLHYISWIENNRRFYSCIIDGTLSSTRLIYEEQLSCALMATCLSVQDVKKDVHVFPETKQFEQILLNCFY